MKSKIPRILLGVVFLTAGINGFYNFLPEQTYSPEGQTFIDSLKEMGFLWSLLKVVEIVAGTLLIFNVMGQFGVLMLIPICVGILFFHAFSSPEGSTLGWIAIALEVTMLIVWRDHFKKLFTADNTENELEDLDFDEEDNTDVTTAKEQEKIANRPNPSKPAKPAAKPTPSTLDQNL